MAVAAVLSLLIASVAGLLVGRWQVALLLAAATAAAALAAGLAAGALGALATAGFVAGAYLRAVVAEVARPSEVSRRRAASRPA